MLGQGDFKFLPQVKVFGPNLDPTIIEQDINAWLVGWIIIDDFTMYKTHLQWTSAQRANNQVEYCALLGFMLVESI